MTDEKAPEEPQPTAPAAEPAKPAKPAKKRKIEASKPPKGKTYVRKTDKDGKYYWDYE